MTQLIVLTKSSMHKKIGGEDTAGACVVGYSPDSRKLIRLTQEPNGAPLNGRNVRRFSIMDEIEVEITEKTPAPPQNENVLIPQEGIRRLGISRMKIQEIAREYIPGETLAEIAKRREFIPLRSSKQNRSRLSGIRAADGR